MGLKLNFELKYLKAGVVKNKNIYFKCTMPSTGHDDGCRPHEGAILKL